MRLDSGTRAASLLMNRSWTLTTSPSITHAFTTTEAVVPKIVDQEEKRASIARAAYDVLSTEGIAGATMRRIAKAAGCSTGMLVHYFKGKQDVLLSAHEHASTDVRARMEACEREASGLSLLRALLMEVLPLDARRCGNWLIWISFWDESVADAVRPEQDKRVLEWRGRLKRALDQAVDAGELPETVNVADETDTIAALLEGLAIQVVVHRRRIGARRQIQLVERHLTRLASVPA